ncbi:MAG: rRNA adenine N-6-methyltransferase family protein [Chthoniobacteraceae bacterium]
MKRFLSRPRQVASIVPSSRTLVRKVVAKMDLSRPRIVAEFGPGEGCHTREIVRGLHGDSRLLLFELDRELAAHLSEVFSADPRVVVLNADAATLPQALAERGLAHCDYVVSGIPFSLIEPEKKRALLRATFEMLAPHDDAAFVIYQVTNELRDRGHCDYFPRTESEYCLANIPPMFVTKFFKTANGSAHNGRH